MCMNTEQLLQYLKYWRRVDTVDIFTSGGDGEEGQERCRQDDGEPLYVMFSHLII